MPDSSPPAGGVAVTSLSRSFGEVKAVNDLTFTAPPGQVTALVGPNGCGKTTLMLMLASLLVPDSGTMRVAGLDPVTQPRDVRRVLGWMPDGFGTWDVLTVREVLHFVGAAYRCGPHETRRRVEELGHLLHLDDLMDRAARTLSRGQKQRLGMARAMLHRPSVLLLDEPASGLDPRSRIELRDIVRGAAQAGATVLISSHILTELEEMSDRAIIMDAGAAVASHNLTDRSTRTSMWRISALNPTRLEQALTALEADYSAPPSTAVEALSRGSLDVAVGSDADAAALLTSLVTDGVQVCEFVATGSDLESVYMATTQERT